MDYCVCNSKFLLMESKFSEKYEIVKTKHKDSGYVKKYKKTGGLVIRYPYFLFKLKLILG